MKTDIKFETNEMSAEVCIGGRSKTMRLVTVTIDGMFMGANDLRETAKRLKKEAKRLEKNSTTTTQG